MVLAVEVQSFSKKIFGCEKRVNNLAKRVVTQRYTLRISRNTQLFYGV